MQDLPHFAGQTGLNAAKYLEIQDLPHFAGQTGLNPARYLVMQDLPHVAGQTGLNTAKYLMLQDLQYFASDRNNFSKISSDAGSPIFCRADRTKCSPMSIV